ncbi:hypothetical protein [Marixanthomonas spongiae]|nr:hypothetical protein [Marixanthomonas spongiae]
MSFKDKVNDVYSNYKDIDKPDYKKYDLTAYADFLELMSLFSNSDGVTRGDFQDRLFGTDDYDKAENRDKDENFVNSIFEKTIQRSILYSDNYPFYIEKNQSEILKLKTEFNDSSKLYLLLLACSNLNIFDSVQPLLTREFEKVSAITLKDFLPKNAVVKEFGENSDYKGNTISKIKDLAKDAGLKLNEEEINEISPYNSKEKGCDIFSWVNFGDSNKNKLIFIAQCTCQKKFESKLSEVNRFTEYFIFYKKLPIQLFFIPFSYINQENKFENSDKFISDYLYFERLRIVTTCKSMVFSDFQASELVDGLIAYQENYID